MSIKEDIYRVVEELPESVYPAVLEQLERFRDAENDAYLLALARIPIDDEPDTPEEAAYDEEARQEFLRGETHRWEDVERELFP